MTITITHENLDVEVASYMTFSSNDWVILCCLDENGVTALCIDEKRAS
jgi:hypothetical protein